MNRECTRRKRTQKAVLKCKTALKRVNKNIQDRVCLIRISLRFRDRILCKASPHLIFVTLVLGDVLCSSQYITQLISNLIGREWSFFVFCLYFAFYPRHTLLIMPQYIAGIVNLTVHMPVSSKLSLWSFMLIFCQLIGPVSVSSVFFNLVSVLPLDLLLLLSD